MQLQIKFEELLSCNGRHFSSMGIPFMLNRLLKLSQAYGLHFESLGNTYYIKQGKFLRRNKLELIRINSTKILRKFQLEGSKNV